MHEHNNQHQGGENPPTPEQEPHPVPRIYVASLSDYNAGRLHGEWIPVGAGAEELHERVQSMLGRSAEAIAEEWAIHDYEGFDPVRLHEYEPLERVAALAAGIREHGPAFAHWAAQHGGDPHELLERFDDAYLGHWDTVEAFAESLWEDFGYAEILEQAIPEHLGPYVRFYVEAFARDLVLAGDITTSAGDGGVYVFNGAA